MIEDIDGYWYTFNKLQMISFNFICSIEFPGLFPIIQGDGAETSICFLTLAAAASTFWDSDWSGGAGICDFAEFFIISPGCGTVAY